MANVTKRGDAYRIRVSNGYDINGKQIFKSKTIKPPPNPTPKQLQKHIDEAVLDFERQVKLGGA